MKPLLAPLLASALVFSAPLHAQTPAPIEKRMSAEAFKAAGLDKLTPAELTRLNAWLSHAAADPTALERAREEGRREMVKKNRGFFDFGASEPIESRLSGEFRGFGRGKEYALENGQVWQQTDDTTLYGVREHNPEARIRPGMLGVWWLRVGNNATQAKVKRIK
ncbi:hypothetical protein EBB59_04425 [Lysobacter pythonis]|uniref:Secreted protein n=1 Tax=Solilutibacter pythonis TaxID=2483112 RepID=A0A3M2HUV4_9GAMM|nr:hypothetical protein [Lysobacter pythonis]RMH93501.1 hypothetical protein EBB59_04425 [Lysobacter pythonis]